MTNEEKRLVLINAGIELYKANANGCPNKVLKGIAARDAIRYALKGTIGEDCTDWFLTDITPWCQPFDDLQMLKMTALAGAIAEGDAGLIKGYRSVSLGL